MEITIDKHSGYCFGVNYAIQMAEDYLKEFGTLYCLGDIVHNSMEVERLKEMGLKIIDHEDLKQLKNTRVLIRAHGEPPLTYRLAIENNIELVDATCPVVLKLQLRVKNAYDLGRQKDTQIVIYGKKGHAEVIGISGQTNDEAIVVSSLEDLETIDWKKPITLFSQTTKSTKGFYDLKEVLEKRMIEANDLSFLEKHFNYNDSICRQVSNRDPKLRQFAKEQDVIIFVSGRKSSNGQALYQSCKEINAKSYFIENEHEIKQEWLGDSSKIGICGATSTPLWLMEKVAASLKKEFQTV